MINNKIVRTEIHYIKNNEELFETCNKSKLLYNSALYLSRQHYFEHKNDENTLKTFLWYNNMYKLLKNSDQYKALPAQTSQAIIKMVDRNWKSYRKSIKVY